ncbi:MAG TPA: hypothetical protein VLK84_09130 [Longimicrobium sp.]|nr:hypothetical protein [Longimicrobium sp.]
MKNLPRLGALALAVMLTSAACSSNNRGLAYPGSARPNVIDRNGDGYDDRTGARISGNRDGANKNKDKGRRDEARCNNGNGNGNGNGRCRNGNRGRGNGRGDE